MQVKIIHTVLGDAIIGDMVHETAETVSFRNPLVFNFVEQRDGTSGLGFARYHLFGNTDIFEFRKTALINVPYEPDSQLEKTYIENSTGIQIASVI